MNALFSRLALLTTLAFLAATVCCRRANAAPPPLPAVTADFYVSPAGRDTWSGTRAEANKTKSDGPFATLDRARDAVRAKAANGLTKNVRVVVRGGTYYLPGGLALGPDDGGTARHSVIWAGYTGERARLVGGVRVTDWQPYKGSIVRATLPRNAANAGQVFENDARRQLARTGAPGTYLRSAGPVAAKEQTAFTYAPGDLDPATWGDKAAGDARVFIWPGSNWFSADKPVSSVDPAARTITLGNTEGYPMKPGDRFFLYNVLALLDTPGEAVVQASQKAVYLWPTKFPSSGKPSSSRPRRASSSFKESRGASCATCISRTWTCPSRTATW